MSRSTLSLAVLFAVFVLMCWLVPQALLIGFAGALIGVGLRALAAPLAVHTPLSSGWAVLVVTLLLGLLLGGGAYVASVPLTEQATAFSEQLPRALEALRQSLADYPWAQRQLEPGRIEAMLPSTDDMANWALAGLSGTFGALGNMVVVLLLAMYLAGEPSGYRRGFVALVAPEHRARAMHVLASTGVALRGWLSGAMVSMAFSGLATFLGLWMLGIPLAPLLGAITALFGFIPYLGPVLSAVPAALVTLGHDPSLLPWAMAVYFATQVLEGNVVTPVIQKHTSDIPPALLIFAQTVMGLISGLLGVALAAPLAVALMVAVRVGYVEGHLERDEDGFETGSRTSH